MTNRMIECRTCGRNHRAVRTLLKCRFPRAAWIAGDGEIALLAWCKVLTISLHEHLDDAEMNKAFIDRTGCGSRCHRDHRIWRFDQ